MWLLLSLLVMVIRSGRSCNVGPCHAIGGQTSGSGSIGNSSSHTPVKSITLLYFGKAKCRFDMIRANRRSRNRWSKSEGKRTWKERGASWKTTSCEDSNIFVLAKPSASDKKEALQTWVWLLDRRLGRKLIALIQFTSP